MIEIIGTIATLLSISGVVMNNYKLWPCFIVWLISNSLCAWVHYRKKVWSLLVRDIVFMLLAIHGLILWTTR